MKRTLDEIEAPTSSSFSKRVRLVTPPTPPPSAPPPAKQEPQPTPHTTALLRSTQHREANTFITYLRLELLKTKLALLRGVILALQHKSASHEARVKEELGRQDSADQAFFEKFEYVRQSGQFGLWFELDLQERTRREVESRTVRLRRLEKVVEAVVLDLVIMSTW